MNGVWGTGMGGGRMGIHGRSGLEYTIDEILGTTA